MDRAEAVKILEIQLDVTDVNTPSCIKLHEALDLAIEALSVADDEVVDFNNMISGGGERIRNLPPVNQKQITGKLENAENATSKGEESTMNQPKSKLDCISRQQAIEAIEGVDWYRVNPKGELVSGSTSDEESWYKAEDIYKAIESLPPVEDMGEVSDGYHTFNQLYHQRAVLFATIVNLNNGKAWKSWKHEDGKFCFDKEGEWFIVGVDTPEGSYTYHYEKKYWDMFDCEELDRGKHWDGHTEEDVTRLLSLPPATPPKKVIAQIKVDTDEVVERIKEEYEIKDRRVCEDYISREYILSFLDGEVMGDDDYIAGMNDEQREIREVVRNAPSVTPTERTGEWKEVMIRTDSGIAPVKDWWYCSLCNNHVSYKYNYCPNCGAKMGGDTE